MITHLAMADHEASIQRFGEIVQLDAALVNRSRRIPDLRLLVRLRCSVHMTQKLVAQPLARGQRPRLLAFLSEKMAALQAHHDLELGLRVAAGRARLVQSMLECPDIHPAASRIEAQLSAG